MSHVTHKVALVTGANSGIGFATAALLAETGYRKVILACRTLANAETAQKQLMQRVGHDVFEPLAIDVAEVESAQRAVDALKGRNDIIDVLILNAGVNTGSKRAFNSDGIELSFAAALIGHHVLTLRLLADGLLAPDAHIIISGSEGARGDMPGANIIDFRSFAQEHFNGDLAATLESIMRVEAPYNTTGFDVYVIAKVFVAWWAASLAQHIPRGMVVNAISPGSVPATNILRNQSFVIRQLVTASLRLTGMAHSLATGAQRYLAATNFTPETSGLFFASPPRKLTGDLVVQRNDHLLDRDLQDAAWQVITLLTER